MKATAEQLKRTIQEWSGYAGEPVKIEAFNTKTDNYAYGSEIACLRLFLKFGGGRNEGNKVAYSENLETWYFRLAPRI